MEKEFSVCILIAWSRRKMNSYGIYRLFISSLTLDYSFWLKKPLSFSLKLDQISNSEFEVLGLANATFLEFLDHHYVFLPGIN